MALNRFIKAQDGIYSKVLSEIKSNKKRSHWMWFIFPQIKGLGSSPMAIKYAIQDLDEAKKYLKHPELSKRLKECIQILLDNKNVDIKEVFGFPDYLKFNSSLTLFWYADNQNENSIYKKAIDIFYSGEIDIKTIGLLKFLNKSKI
jgi:uncharacterized protein (DUF1810 family)